MLKKTSYILSLFLHTSLVCISENSIQNPPENYTNQTPTHVQLTHFIYKVYEWFNLMVNPNNSLDLSELQSMVTPDFFWQSSDEVWAHDYNSLCDVIHELREGPFLLKIIIPFDEIIISDDHRKYTLRYTIEKKYYTGTTETGYVIAIWSLANDGRLKRIYEVSHMGS